MRGRSSVGRSVEGVMVKEERVGRREGKVKPTKRRKDQGRIDKRYLSV